MIVQLKEQKEVMIAKELADDLMIAARALDGNLQSISLCQWQIAMLAEKNFLAHQRKGKTITYEENDHAVAEFINQVVRKHNRRIISEYTVKYYRTTAKHFENTPLETIERLQEKLSFDHFVRAVRLSNLLGIPPLQPLEWAYTEDNVPTADELEAAYNPAVLSKPVPNNKWDIEQFFGRFTSVLKKRVGAEKWKKAEPLYKAFLEALK